MKCQLCNEKKGSTRCEGCDMLFCLQCMNKHHGELMQQYQQLMDVRNELKESLNTSKIVSQSDNKLSCIIEIDRWEQKTIERIREIAKKVRKNVNEIVTKNITAIHYELEQVSANMQQQEKEGNYLENDIEKIKLQLENLKETVQHINEKIQVIIPDNIKWDTLIHIVTDEDSLKDYYNSTESLIQNKDTTNKVKKSINNRRIEENPAFRPVVRLPIQSNDSSAFRPISPPDLLQEDFWDSPRNSPETMHNFIPIDKTPSILSTQGSSSKLIFRKKTNN